MFYTRKLRGIAGTRPESYFIRNRTSYPKLPLNFSSKQVALAFNTVDGSRPPFQKFTRSWNMHLRAIYNEPLKSIEQKIRLCYFIIVKVAARDVIRDNNTKIRRDKYNYQLGWEIIGLTRERVIKN